ncbi:restriction endonuclease S subunit [Bradyrhizobium sp. USDA 3311]
MDRLKRITELVAQKSAIDAELKTLKEQIAQESAALKKTRKPRQKKDQQNV